MEGLAISLYVYFFLILLFRFSGLVALGFVFYNREDAMLLARQQYNMLNNNNNNNNNNNDVAVAPLPPRSRTLLYSIQAVVSAVLVLQAFATGYLFKCFLYSTSRVGWSWEAAPLMGTVLLMYALTCWAAVASCCRHGWSEWRRRQEPPNTEMIGLL
ncbi:hypothetical protein AGDE_15826 [Angomonas deanei]|uniref:Uncharacterized protein n=1 Tax=Angomonas deanei TaxID=59799 RepID=A0A7G2C2D3_9TRYP|nr:hypothetical protein AGDE_15826 [Angomonas deanei]CAD2213695.1 hypothetical protein, conserved [Angomonas deanei]|eukprot:EPY18305.1 hypothetical protein AGDE_15826 [Angomonas deanei]